MNILTKTPTKLSKDMAETISFIKPIADCVDVSNNETIDIGLRKQGTNEPFDVCVLYAIVKYNNKECPLYFLIDRTNYIKMFVIIDGETSEMFTTQLDFDSGVSDLSYDVILEKEMEFYGAGTHELTKDEIDEIEVIRKYETPIDELSGFSPIQYRMFEYKIAEIEFRGKEYSVFSVCYDGFHSTYLFSIFFVDKINERFGKKYRVRGEWSRLKNEGDLEMINYFTNKLGK